MKPIPDRVADANPELHALFVAWVEASKDLQAAILQKDPRVALIAKESLAKLDAYLTAMAERISKADSALQVTRQHVREHARILEAQRRVVETQEHPERRGERRQLTLSAARAD